MKSLLILALTAIGCAPRRPVLRNLVIDGTNAGVVDAKYLPKFSSVALPCLLVLALVGCAAPQRVTAINTVDTMADAAGVALRAYSHEHIEAIIHRPNITAAAAQTEMTAFYAKVDKAESDLTDLRGLIKNARAVNDAPTLNTLEAKAASIVAELKAFEVR